MVAAQLCDVWLNIKLFYECAVMLQCYCALNLSGWHDHFSANTSYKHISSMLY